VLDKRHAEEGRGRNLVQVVPAETWDVARKATNRPIHITTVALAMKRIGMERRFDRSSTSRPPRSAAAVMETTAIASPSGTNQLIVGAAGARRPQTSIGSPITTAIHGPHQTRAGVLDEEAVSIFGRWSALRPT
jgi:hypothetical protein